MINRTAGMVAACGTAVLLLSGCQGTTNGTQRAGARPAATGAGVNVHAAPGDGQDAYSSQVARSMLREKALDILSRACVSTEPLLRANGIEGLQSAPARAEDAVRAGLADENAGVRFVAAYTVGQLKMRRSAPFVQPLLADADQRVRAGAIYALTACGQKPDPTPLGDMLRDSGPQVRSEAARVIGDMGNASAIPMLKSAVASSRGGSSGGADERSFQMERLFQLQVAEALAKLGDASAVDAIRAALYPKEREGFESAALAAQMLGALKWDKSAGELVNLIEQTVGEAPAATDVMKKPYLQPKEVRLSAAAALARMGFPGGIYVADMYANDPDPMVRSEAMFVYGWGGRRADLGKLDRGMADEAVLVQIAAAAGSLRSLRGPKG